MLDHAPSLTPRWGNTGALADPVQAIPEELEAERPPPPADCATGLLRRPDFRRLFTAVAASELGDALHYIALMRVALEAGSPLGVVAVRLADSVPALIFGLHGGLAADRWDRRRVMIAADLTRGGVLVPVAVGGLTGHLPIWALVPISVFFAANAATFFVSVADRRHRPSRGTVGHAEPLRTREGFAALRPRSELAVGVARWESA